MMPVTRPSGSDSTASIRSGESSDSDPLGQQSELSYSSLLAHTSLPTYLLKGGGGGGGGGANSMAAAMMSSANACSESADSGSGGGGGGGGDRGSILSGLRNISTARMTSEHSSSAAASSSDTPRKRSMLPQDCAAVVVWLEKFEDHLNFPLESLSKVLHATSLVGLGSQKSFKRSLPTIFIHKLSSGLYQIKVKAVSGRYVYVYMYSACMCTKYC